ncbi:MAG: hypothetical protein AB7U81_15255 [Thiohalomonadaceae bacterium]
MKHLAELWDTIAPRIFPVVGTREDLRTAFERWDRVLEIRIRAAGRVTLSDTTAALYADVETMARGLIKHLSTLPLEERTAAAEHAQELVTLALERAFAEALASFAEKAARMDDRVQTRRKLPPPNDQEEAP